MFKKAHRINTIADYDKIIMMEGGRVVEQGNTYELLEGLEDNNK